MKRLALLLLASLSVASAGENAAEARKAKLAYAQKLDALLAKAKSAGDAADVKEIEVMIAEVEGKAAADKSGDTLASLAGTWQHENGDVWRINDSKGGTVGGKHQFTMTFDHVQRRVVVVGGNWVNHLTFTGDVNLLNGSYEKGGRTHRFKLSRVK